MFQALKKIFFKKLHISGLSEHYFRKCTLLVLVKKYVENRFRSKRFSKKLMFQVQMFQIFQKIHVSGPCFRPLRIYSSKIHVSGLSEHYLKNPHFSPCGNNTLRRYSKKIMFQILKRYSKKCMFQVLDKLLYKPTSCP